MPQPIFLSLPDIIYQIHPPYPKLLDWIGVLATSIGHTAYEKKSQEIAKYTDNLKSFVFDELLHSVNNEKSLFLVIITYVACRTQQQPHE